VSEHDAPSNDPNGDRMGGRAVRVLVVDDDPMVADSLAEFFRGEGCGAASASCADEALAHLARVEHEDDPGLCVALIDVNLPGTDGLSLLRTVRREHPRWGVVMLTGYASVETAVEALRTGATDFLTKPVVDDELRLALGRALRTAEVSGENADLRSRLDRASALEGIVGTDPTMARIAETVRAVAPSRTTVLMTGESGTGKSLVARSIHGASSRAGGAFVELSCGSIPETLLESELFGHVKGAFTGAHADKPGRFLAADGGTLFLDEINSASPGMQLKLLRVLQERKFEPVGSSETLEVDARVILASNQPLEELVERGAFRQDLYYRINVVRIELPPLRERRADIPALARHFLDEQSAELGRALVGFTDGAMDAIVNHAFPGNVRELSNIVEHAAVLAKGQTITIDDLPESVIASRDGGAPLAPDTRISGDGEDDGTDEDWAPMPLSEALRDPERRIILRTLDACGWNRTKAAAVLEINRTTLYKKMKALGIDPEHHASAG